MTQLSNGTSIPQLRMTKLRRKVLRAITRANAGKAKRPIFRRGGMFGGNARSQHIARWETAQPWKPVAYEIAAMVATEKIVSRITGAETEVTSVHTTSLYRALNDLERAGLIEAYVFINRRGRAYGNQQRMWAITDLGGGESSYTDVVR